MAAETSKTIYIDIWKKWQRAEYTNVFRHWADEVKNYVESRIEGVKVVINLDHTNIDFGGCFITGGCFVVRDEYGRIYLFVPDWVAPTAVFYADDPDIAISKAKSVAESLVKEGFQLKENLLPRRILSIEISNPCPPIFQEKANQIKEGLLASSAGDRLKVKINAGGAPAGHLIVRDEHGQPLIKLADMLHPYPGIMDLQVTRVVDCVLGLPSDFLF